MHHVPVCIEEGIEQHEPKHGRGHPFLGEFSGRNRGHCADGEKIDEQELLHAGYKAPSALGERDAPIEPAHHTTGPLGELLDTDQQQAQGREAVAEHQPLGPGDVVEVRLPRSGEGEQVILQKQQLASETDRVNQRRHDHGGVAGARDRHDARRSGDIAVEDPGSSPKGQHASDHQQLSLDHQIVVPGQPGVHALGDQHRLNRHDAETERNARREQDGQIEETAGFESASEIDVRQRESDQQFGEEQRFQHVRFAEQGERGRHSQRQDRDIAPEPDHSLPAFTSMLRVYMPPFRLPVSARFQIAHPACMASQMAARIALAGP